jgi:hypothetical protein
MARISLQVETYLSVGDSGIKRVLPILEETEQPPLWLREFISSVSKLDSDIRQLVRHLSKRLPCQCLDEYLPQMTKDEYQPIFVIHVIKDSPAKTANAVPSVV